MKKSPDYREAEYEANMYPNVKPKKISKFRQWLKNFLGISEIITKLHNMDGDIMCVMEKQMNPLQTLPVDPPECDENSPYEYLVDTDPRTRFSDKQPKHDYYVLWSTGFAGPFEIIEKAQEYSHYLMKYHQKLGSIEKLCPIPFIKK